MSDIEHSKPGPTPILDLPGKWDEFLSHVRGGMGGYKALEHMGHSWRTLNRYFRQHPDKAQEFYDAKYDSREVPAMRVFMDIMENGEKDSDRIAAADKLLAHSRKDMAEVVVRHDHQHTLDPNQLSTIMGLQELAASRIAAATPIEVGFTEIPDKEQTDG